MDTHAETQTKRTRPFENGGLTVLQIQETGRRWYQTVQVANCPDEIRSVPFVDQWNVRELLVWRPTTSECSWSERARTAAPSVSFTTSICPAFTGSSTAACKTVAWRRTLLP